MYYRVWVASQRFHGAESLTYSATDKLSVGQLVLVPLQGGKVAGIVAATADKPAFSTKAISEAWPVILPKQSLQLLQWLMSYYPAPLGSLTELFTPPALTKRLEPISQELSNFKPLGLPPLTPEQARTIQTIRKAGPTSILLHGDTGTGKTRVYTELALQTVDSGKSVIVLTPEIGLTKQLLDTFSETLGPRVVVTHSDMTPAQRRQVWLQINGATGPIIVIGPRSALFTPVKNVGLIIMDEAHDSAYKQEQTPYYQTSRVSAQLAHLHKAPFIMGTATPSVADYFTFEQKKLPIVRMTNSAIPVSDKIGYSVIDHRDKALFTRSSWLSNPLLKAIDAALEQKEQTLLFLNRRGSARLVFCEHCGWQAICPHCDIALTYHQDQHLMRCHSCNFSDKVPSICPSCGANELIFKSIGTKALETEIRRIYPNARIARFDRDTEKSLRLSTQYPDLHSGAIDILIGTQAVAKGFDLPKLSVVGIVQADSGLQIPDYTATERTYQLLSQVSGRIGRGHRAGKLFLQTFDPDSPLIALAIRKDYHNFYKGELSERQNYNFPPFAHLMKVTCLRATGRSALQACQQIAVSINAGKLPVLTEGPSPRFIEKIGGRYGWHLVIKSKSRQNLLKIIASLPGNCTYDLDPSDLL